MGEKAGVDREERKEDVERKKTGNEMQEQGMRAELRKERREGV